MTRAIAVICLLLGSVAPTAAQSDPCRFLCEPTLLVEPTITFEADATVFETIFALDLATPIPRVGVTFEAITKPFQDENEVELESELKLVLAGIRADRRLGLLTLRHRRQVQPGRACH